jgi:uncharacterized SAM-binding protein YcdF (DUF218 family)
MRGWPTDSVSRRERGSVGWPRRAGRIWIGFWPKSVTGSRHWFSGSSGSDAWQTRGLSRRCYRSRVRARRSILPILLVVAALVLVPIVASAVSVWRAAHTDEASEVDRADVILVLGAAQYGGTPSPIFRGRLDHGALLYERGFADRVMVLGAGQAGDVTTEAQAGADYLVGRGIPQDAVHASPVGRSTFESLRGAVRQMEARELDSAFLVSDPWHNLRIRRMARDLGIEGYVSATWHSAAESQYTRLQGYARETFAYLYYRVFGR